MKRKLIRTITCITAALTIFGSAFSCSAAVVTDGKNFYSLGDANTDNSVDIRDLVRIKKNMATGYDLLKAAADINGDGTVNASDLVLVKQYLIGANDVLEPDNSLWNTEIK